MRAILALATLTIAVGIGPADAAEPPPTKPLPAASAIPAAQPGARKAEPPPGAPAAAKAPAKKPPAKTVEYKGPTQDDIRAAYAQRVERINAGSAKFLSEGAAAQVQLRLIKVDFVECNPAEERTDLYICNVIVESSIGKAEPDFKRVELVLAKENRAWTVR